MGINAYDRAERAGTLESDMEHSTEDDFQHFLSYSGLRLKIPSYIGELRQAFYAGADVPHSPEDIKLAIASGL